MTYREIECGHKETIYYWLEERQNITEEVPV